MISIIVTVHNKQDMIEKVCYGITNNISNLTKEIIVVFDACTDNSESIVKSILDSKSISI